MRTYGGKATSVVVMCVLLNLSVVLALFGSLNNSLILSNESEVHGIDPYVNPLHNVNLEEGETGEEGGLEIDSSCHQSMKFADHASLRQYLMTSSQQNWTWIHSNWVHRLTLGGPEPDLNGPSSSDYSPTNIQVQGVDEPDIVKTDGRYVYVISRYDLVILQAYPGEEAEVLSRIHSEQPLAEMFVSGSRLVLFKNHNGTQVSVYDIESRTDPQLIATMSLSGHYLDSRRIDDRVYVVARQYAWWYGSRKKPIALPVIGKDNLTRAVGASEICHFGEASPIYQFTLIASIDLQTNNLQAKAYLIDGSQTLYVSKNNIYLAHIDHSSSLAEIENRSAATVIHKISIDQGDIEYAGSGYIPGRLLNQFSMDEDNGNLRVATTTGRFWRTDSVSRNNVYVLDEAFQIVGRLEDLAPGERIYSARFIGDRCYLVTFKKVDPFFVINLANPESPEVLGELKIPGYSDYLHPYDENHIIGLGKDTYDMGDFAWYQGLKLSLFDVTNVSDPKEVSKYIIGDRGTHSYALYDHKAFMFSKSKDLLVIPISLYEVEDKNAPPQTSGRFVWQGAHVFTITTESGFVLKGRITHMDYDVGVGDDWRATSHIKRALYIEDEIYTISEKMVKVNKMDTLEEVARVGL
jgi:uncharacterized secreted protein with C-terminal beta-propeller domain